MKSETLQHWKSTEYRFIAGQQVLILRVGSMNPEVDTLLEEHPGEGLAFISNFNPRGERYEEKANGQRTRAFQSWLLRAGLPHWQGLGVPSADSDWLPETSFAIAALTRQKALKIAQQCEQLGFVWHPQGGKSELINAENGQTLT